MLKKNKIILDILRDKLYITYTELLDIKARISEMKKIYRIGRIN